VIGGNLEAAFDIALNEIVHHGLHGGNDGGHRLQIDSTRRTTTRGRSLAIRWEAFSICAGRTEDRSRLPSLVLFSSSVT
jgi:hypothetical protein